MKVHVALNTPRFDESVRFYRTFLGLEPVKLKPGYAKFDVAEPGLNLTLNASSDTGPGALNHLGIQVQSTAAVREAAERLKAQFKLVKSYDSDSFDDKLRTGAPCLPPAA